MLQVASISQLTVSRLSRQCGILDISQSYMPLQQGWANRDPRATCGPLRVFLWPAKTVRKIRLEPRFSSRARPKSFSCLKINKSKYRCSLTDINLQAVMRISTSNLTPDLKKFVEKCDKVHLSH
jgi:hypothetical protein